MGLRMWFLESCGDMPQKEVTEATDCPEQPFTCPHSLFCESRGRRWIECKKDGKRCKRGCVDWWEEWLKEEDRK